MRPIGNAAVLLAIVACCAAQTTQVTPLFENVAAEVDLNDVGAARVSFADLNNDHYPDLLLGCGEVFLNQRGRRFTRTAAESRLLPDNAAKPGCVQVGDVNCDGFLDLFLGFSVDTSESESATARRHNEIWIGDGQGGFALLTGSGIGQHPDVTISACFLDYDRDGHLDLFVGNSYDPAGGDLEAFPDRLYRGNGDGTFTDVTQPAGLLGVAEPGLADSRRPTYGVAHTDWNNDGWQDLLVMTYGRQWNRLWRSNGDGTFTDVAPQATFDGDSDRSGRYAADVKAFFLEKYGAEREDEPPFRANGNTFDCAVADYDNDGDMDCFLAEITHAWAGPSSDLSTLLTNQGAPAGFRFQRETERIPRTRTGTRWNQGDLHAGWLDLENDGRLDLLIACSDYPDDQVLRLYHQEPDGTFDDWTPRLGIHWINASQISLADFDRDGATDILVGTNNMRLTAEQRASRPLAVGLLRNLAARRAGNGFLNIRLLGQAVGARVTIWIDDRRQTREVHGGLGHAGHRDDSDCRFGIGKADSVDRVVVRWPDAALSTQAFENVRVNRFYTLRRGGKLEPLSQ